MKYIVMSTMTKLPENCVECPFQACNIPMKADGITFRKDSVKKRNPHCPLREVEVKDG